jgi:hypothetical protein
VQAAGTLARSSSIVVFGALLACAHRSPPPQPPQPVVKKTLAVLPAESDAFPKAARAVSDSLTKAQVSGVDETRVSKVSLEVVQLQIECIDQTTACYSAVGKSLSANKLLFAQLAPGGTKKQLKVTVTLFDVDTQLLAKRAERVFSSEAEATAGVPELVGEATAR